jgi:flagellar basal-body rod protein FlgC
MNTAMNIAASGMYASTMRLSATASNVANLRSNGKLPSGEQDQTTAQKTDSAYQAVAVSQTATADGSVQAAIKPVQPTYMPAYDPDSSDANEQGMVATPNVDLGNETANRIEGSQAYQASANAMKAADNNLKSLLNLTV